MRVCGWSTARIRMVSWRALCGTYRSLRACRKNCLKLSHLRKHAIIWLGCRSPFLEVASSISTARLVSSFTSSELGPISASPECCHHVYHCARPSWSYEVHDIALKNSFINWKCATIFNFTRIDILSLGQWLWLKRRAISTHICVTTHINAISRACR